jgi:hypothetical protein
MHEHAEVLNVLLSHARTLLDEKALPANQGFQIFVLDLPNMEFIIEAKRSSLFAYTYIIRSYDRRYIHYSARPQRPRISSLMSASPSPGEQRTAPSAPPMPLDMPTPAVAFVPQSLPSPPSSRPATASTTMARVVDRVLSRKKRPT